MHPDPRYQALAHAAEAAMRTGDDAAAERAARALVQANPREHAAWHALAIVALRAGNAAAAAELAERAHRLERKNPGYLNTLGIVYGDLGRAEEAIAAFRRALKLRPAFVDGHYNLARVFARHERLPEAREAYRRVLAIDPKYPGAKHNLARVLRRLGQNAAALAQAREAYDEQPDDVDRMLSFANALADVRGFPAGAEFATQCLRRRPDDERLHHYLAAALLMLGEWDAGWREYLWRPEAVRGSSAFPERLPDNLEGGAVLLMPDQRLGDTLFFLRFAAAIRARSGKAILRAPAKLAGVLREHGDLEHGDLDHVVTDDATDGGPLPPGIEIKAKVLLGDLPYVLGSRAVAPPFPLRARVELVDAWRQTLAALGPPPYVGLTWRGGTDLRTASEFGVQGDLRFRDLLFKEIRLALLAGAVKDAPGTLVAVQRLPAVGEVSELAALAGRPVHDLSAANDDLERMIALLAALDEYVGVSNTNTHLRAGIGSTAKVLVPYPPEFRWMAEGDRSPWFPGFGVYRQGADRSWTAALARLRSDLSGA